MQRFANLGEFQSMLKTIGQLPFDDDRVEFDIIQDNLLTIRFNNVTGKTIVDSEGKEREVFQQLVIRNFVGFDILSPHSGTHLLKSVKQTGSNQYEVNTDYAKWQIQIDGEFEGVFGESVDDTDFEISITRNTIGIAAAGMAVVGGILLWIF